MKRITLATILFLIAALVIGCGASNLASRPQEMPAPAQPPAATAAPPAPAMESYDSGQRKGLSGSTANDAIAQDTQRMIVYTGSISLQVNDTADTVNKITALLNSVNGYIANKSLVAYGKDKLRGTITIRIPSAALTATLDQIKALGVKVLREDANSNDVTEEYVDLDARRKNLEAYEVELTKLLETVRERTGKAEDILAVYNQLTEVRGQIEQIKGRQTYLENTSALATYSIELVPLEEVVVEGQEGWDPGRTARQALDQLVATLQGLTDAVIVLAISVLPVLVLLLLPFVILVLILRAVMKRRVQKKPAAA